jgi:hypothetical protein
LFWGLDYNDKKYIYVNTKFLEENLRYLKLSVQDYTVSSLTEEIEIVE